MQHGWGPPQQPYWAKPRIDRSLLRPKAGWYALSVLPFVLGVAALATFIVLAVGAFPEEPTPFVAPGTHVLRLDHPEDQTIYRHSRTGGVAAVGGVPNCSVRNQRTERSVPVRQSGTTTLTLGADKYEAMIDFDPPSAGTYRVTCQPTAGAASQPLAVGERLRFGRFALLIGAAIVSFLLGGLLGAVVIAVVAVMRNSHKRRLERELSEARPPPAPGGPSTPAFRPPSPS